jgi:OOP family OmpA-OmpF porin
LKPIKYLPVIAFAAILGACAGPAPRDIDTVAVRGVPQLGTDFQKALSDDYVVLAQSELNQSDRSSTTYYNTKSRQAAAGLTVLPTRMDERSISSANVAELTDARAKLMRVIDAGGPSRAPVQTSRAQTQFDCWMEQREENFQPDDIRDCRNGFLRAIDDVSTIVFAVVAPTPAPAPKKVAAPAAPTKLIDIATYTIYFDHNSATLNNAAVAMNNEIASRIKSTQSTSVTVNGYTDRSGDREYNRLLAERRAANVSSALEYTGIKPMVGSQSYGEDRSAVQTADNVREWHNRRVVVTLRK